MASAMMDLLVKSLVRVNSEQHCIPPLVDVIDVDVNACGRHARVTFVQSLFFIGALSPSALELRVKVGQLPSQLSILKRLWRCKTTRLEQLWIAA